MSTSLCIGNGPLTLFLKFDGALTIVCAYMAPTIAPKSRDNKEFGCALEDRRGQICLLVRDRYEEYETRPLSEIPANAPFEPKSFGAVQRSMISSSLE